MRKNTFIQYFMWFSVSMVYYSVSLNIDKLIKGGDFYINSTLLGLIEFPAFGLPIIFLLYFGRRLPMCGMFILGGLSLLGTLFVPAGERMPYQVFPHNLQTLIFTGAPHIIMAGLGKLGITGAFASCYVVSAEIFPTELRQSGLGSASMFARLGAMLAPLIGRELSKYSSELPILIFTTVSISAGLLVLLLPETHNRTLPDTVEEGTRKRP